MTALGGALHDPPAVARCLSAAEALLSGDTGGRWVMPDSLPSSSIYQVRSSDMQSNRPMLLYRTGPKKRQSLVEAFRFLFRHYCCRAQVIILSFV